MRIMEERVQLIIIQAVYTKNGNISVKHRSRKANDGKVGTSMCNNFWYRTVIHLSVDGAEQVFLRKDFEK
jgi:hypothetical protein